MSTADAKRTAADTAEAKLLRGIAWFVGTGALFYLLVLTPDIVAQLDVTALWWTALTVPAIAGAGSALVVSGWRGPDAIRRAAIVLAVAYLACAATFPLAATGVLVEPTRTAWLALFPGLPALALATVVRPLVTITYLVSSGALAHHMTWSLRAADGGILDFLWGISFSALFTGAAFAIVRSGRILDDTAAVAQAGARTSAAAEARAEERRRFDALIHDGVMATLLSAGRSPNSATITEQARATTRQLDLLRSGDQERTAVPAHELVAVVRAAASSIDDAIPVETAGDPTGGILVSAEIASALGAGVIEATRNVRRHAGAGATCRVLVGVGARSVRVDIVDDGVGFDPALVPPHRLGLQVSIHGRFASLDGGWSRVDSAIGTGTRVSIGWEGT